MKSVAISGGLRSSFLGVNEEIAQAKILLSLSEDFTDDL